MLGAEKIDLFSIYATATASPVIPNNFLTSTPGLGALNK
jgi:hypothetical protein